MEEHKRLADIKKSEEELKKALKKMSLAERQTQRLKLEEIKAKREKLRAEYFNCINKRTSPKKITKLHFIEGWFLNALGTTMTAAKKIGPGATQLLKNIQAKFNCVQETAEKLKIPPPPQLSKTEPTTSAKKRKRQQEHLMEIFVTKNVVVDAIFRNLVLTKEITASVHGQVIEEPE
ncbi:hypothetical protein Tco_1188419 [Tanacetum coccineum]